MLLSGNYREISTKEKESVRHVSGEIKPYDVVRQYFTLDLETPLQEGRQRLSLHGNAKKIGAGWAYTQGSDYGITLVGMEWKKPWLETQETVTGFGYRDRLMLTHRMELRQHISLHGELSFSHYGLNGADSAAKSHRVQLGGRYWLRPTRSGISMGYGLDLENVVDRAEREDDFGRKFHPLPLENREQHLIDIGWSNELNEDLTINSQLGYEYDTQRKSNAPYGRLKLEYNPNKNIELSADIHTGLSSYQGKDKRYFCIGTNLSWLF